VKLDLQRRAGAKNPLTSAARRDVPEKISGIKCPESGQRVFYKDVEPTMGGVRSPGFQLPHVRMGAVARHSIVMFDGDTWCRHGVAPTSARFRGKFPSTSAAMPTALKDRAGQDRAEGTRSTRLRQARRVLPVVIGVQDLSTSWAGIGSAWTYRARR